MKAIYVIPAIYVSALVGIGIWAAVDAKGLMANTRGARKKIEGATGKRLPRPDVVILGPTDEETFDGFDEMLCEAALEVSIDAPDLLAKDQEAFINEVVKRTLEKLFPDYPWPATSGDHPSAAEIQGLVKYEVRRSILDNTLCLDGKESPEIIDDDDDDLDDDNFPPSLG